MISCGRGRSRGGAKDIEVPLRRPGENALCKNTQSVCNDVIEEINNLAIDESVSTDQIVKIHKLVYIAKDKTSLISIFDKLYKRALEDNTFSIKLLILFNNSLFFIIKDNEDKTLRKILLSTLQADYTRKEEIRKENDTLFRNVVFLLGETYYYMRLNSGLRLKVLGPPLLNCCNMLLETATEEDIELIVTQIVINGRNLYSTYPTEMDEFMFNVRKTLVNNNLSTLAKGMLLLIIDLANQQFDSLPPNIYDYYMSHLGTTVTIYLQRYKKDLVDATNNDDVTTRDIRKPFSNNNKKWVNKKNFSTGNTVPRAIRGPGASSTERNFKNQSKNFTNPPPSQHSTKNKSEHDDRFENDYE